MIEKPYIVIGVEGFMDGVMMFMKPTDIPTTPNIEPLHHGGIEEQTAERIAKTIVVTMKNMMPDASQRWSKFTVFTIGIYLSLNEYEKLGKPTVNDVIRMQLEVRQEI